MSFYPVSSIVSLIRLGTLIWTDGSKYVGVFENDLRSGWGIMTVENSLEKFEGPWKDGKRHGRGTQVYSDGSKYVGSIINDHRHGKVKSLNNFSFQT